jgi:dTDP-4-amino-4,6-dideoxygalactose transaminase
MARRASFLVPFARPLLPEPAAWLPFLEAAYAERWFSNGGPVVERLEREVGARCAAPGREAVAVSSATAGLTAALMALDVTGPVAMPAFTFPATAHAAVLAGCRPVLCDVDPETWELTPSAVRRAIEVHGAEAVLHVRPFGFVRDITAVQEAAAGRPVVVDSAAAFGGTGDDGRAPGHAGDAEVFSFHATKVMAIGEGGAVVAPAAVAQRIRRAINFALDGIDVAARGLNGKLPEPSAAIGLAALRTLDEHVSVRRGAVARLARAATAGGAATLPVRPGRPAWQGLPVLARDRAARDAAVAVLAEAGIEGRIYYSPGLHRTSAFAGCAPDALPVTDAIVDRILCLPIHADLTGSALEAVARATEAALPGRHTRHAILEAVR